MPDNESEYRLKPAALNDLESIWMYTFERWGLEQADAYVDQLHERLRELAHSPGVGQPVVHIQQDYRRLLVASHFVYYRTTDYGILVVRLLHQRMLAGNHLRAE